MIKILVLITIMMTIVANKFSRQYFLTLFDPNEISWKHHLVHWFTVIGTFLAGLYYILSNGRSYIDDSTRYV